MKCLRETGKNNVDLGMEKVFLDGTQTLTIKENF